MRKIALVGNPNCGKTTLFNVLTGANQKVGNWPGVTISKKEGHLLADPTVVLVDLPGIYSLSPYTMEEVVSRDYLLDERPDLILNVVDGTNLERSLYLTTQLLELEIPMVIAVNMADLLNKAGIALDLSALMDLFDLPVLSISAYRRKGIQPLIHQIQTNEKVGTTINFSPIVEEQLDLISSELNHDRLTKFWAIKYFERDQKMIKKDCVQANCTLIELMVTKSEQWLDSDGESIITSERYDWIETAMTMIKKEKNESLSLTDKIDQVVTHRFLGIPFFLLVMYCVYYLSISTIGSLGTDWVNEELFGQIIPNAMTTFLESVKIHPLVISLVVDGIIGGVGAILGFIPQMAMLFLCLALLEDSGYMARIAFVMDRVFKKFGLSGKSFIPLLVGSGCSVPGIQASRTIENEQNRKLTILTTSFIPCSAKLPVIALIANAIFGGSQWVAFAVYVLGIVSVLVSSILLKKILFGKSKPIPFIMELPAYRMPDWYSILLIVWHKVQAFIKRAGSIIFISSCLVWFLSSFSSSLQVVSDPKQSLLASLGNIFAPIFIPLGFGNWESVAATLQGFVAKENVVSTLGVIQGLSADSTENTGALLSQMSLYFSASSALSFLVFNMLCMPCFAAVGAMRTEFQDDWMAFKAVFYQMFYAYYISYIVYQISLVLIDGYELTYLTWLAISLLICFIGLLFMPADFVYQLSHPFKPLGKEAI
ncbi:ferrous iron transport protein B [Facklamia miroungae]|uniref:Ferrous iron transport protein B n=1 Tax=Facklamia miroungae TaxID=120956 RepID=A0A1G7QIW9_9LACT|nr:ferrous iron transport protein B [Facklamia miroungae]NKZ28940.1 ferrous iron transport protein B [Facklamia miroungae]SDF97869.1 ferrous iron transport protein B [Facklamia miroungae]